MSGVLSFLRNAQNEGSLKFYENRPLSELSSFGIGGPAAMIVYPLDAEALKRTAAEAFSSGTRSIVVGNATNLLFDDLGFDGMVISCASLKRVQYPYRTERDPDGREYIYAECGASLPQLVNTVSRGGITGFEGLCSVPATVGGAIVSNAGAFGCEISDKLLSFEVFEPRTGTTRNRTKRETRFSYRESGAVMPGEVILCALFAAEKGDPEEISERLFAAKKKRLASQPQGVRSAGSYFKRPDAGEGFIPFRGLSAGELIDRCGLKGLRVGGAEVSEKHANFIINKGGATCRDVLTLAERIRETVFMVTGVTLSEEVRYIPYR